jgi:hypothetical protein
VHRGETSFGGATEEYGTGTLSLSIALYHWAVQYPLHILLHRGVYGCTASKGKSHLTSESLADFLKDCLLDKWSFGLISDHLSKSGADVVHNSVVYSRH